MDLGSSVVGRVQQQSSLGFQASQSFWENDLNWFLKKLAQDKKNVGQIFLFRFPKHWNRREVTTKPKTKTNRKKSEFLFDRKVFECFGFIGCQRSQKLVSSSVTRFFGA